MTIHRPVRSRWCVHVACNDYRNGHCQGWFGAVHIGIGRGGFDFGTDYLDDQYIELDGPRTTYRVMDANKIKLGRVTVAYDGYREWYGNWCWDAFFVDTDDVRKLARYLKRRCFGVEDGTEVLSRWWHRLEV